MGKKTKATRAAPERVSGLQSEKDRREALEVFGRAFSDPAGMERHVGECLWRGPTFDPEHTRIAVADGRVVSGLVMGPRTIRFGPARVPAMTIGPVGTHDRYRGRGYMAATMRDAAEYMRRSGILIAYLQGIADFYYRFGYYPFMAPGHVRFQRKDAERQSLPGRLRTMRRTDLARVRRLYDCAVAWRLCAAARDATVWGWLLGPGRRSWTFPGPRLILDKRGALRGYVTLRAGTDFGVGEIVTRRDEQSCRVALGAIAREARRREATEIALPLPWDDPLAVFLRHQVGAEFRLRSHPTGGALMMIVDFPALMRRLQPLFEARWRSFGGQPSGVRLNIESEIGAVGIAADRGGVRVGRAGKGPRVRVPRRWLSGLLTGYHRPADIARRKGARIPSDLMPAMEALFPAAWPWVYQGDNY